MNPDSGQVFFFFFNDLCYNWYFTLSNTGEKAVMDIINTSMVKLYPLKKILV
jgi:hypothetical protein